MGYVYMLPQSWANGGGGTVVVQSGNGPWGGLSTPSNGFFMSIQGAGAYLEQTVSNLEAGATYTVTFQVSQRPGNGAATMSAFVDNEVAWGPEGSQGFAEYSFVFTAAATEATIRFENTSPDGDLSVFLDAVTISRG